MYMTLCDAIYIILFIIYFYQIVKIKMICVVKNVLHNPKSRDLKINLRQRDGKSKKISCCVE